MSTPAGSPAGGRERRIDRDALPDPALWAQPRSPHRAALRRLALGAAGLLLVAGGSGWALRGVLGRASHLRGAAAPLLEGEAGLRAEPAERRPASPEELAALQKSWVGSASIAPRDDRLDPETGERIGHFQGFGLQVDTAPGGARVLVNGEELGTSPLLTTVDCRPGDEVAVRVEHSGASAAARTRCRKDTLVKLQLALKR